MSTPPGSNLPDFKSAQLDFAAHIRHPEINAAPADVEAARMKIYVELFFNNIKNFLDSAFPIAKQIVGDAQWQNLAREFVHKHHSESPYFLQISEEFLTFLDERGLSDLPPFLLELCHYEWVELSLDVAVEDASDQSFDPDAPLTGQLLVSPLVRALVYHYPVHKMGVDHQPQESPDQPTFLLVYRNADLQVRFVASNPVTHRLIGLLESSSLEDALQQIAGELSAGSHEIDIDSLRSQAMLALTHLHEIGIILGAKAA